MKIGDLYSLKHKKGLTYLQFCGYVDEYRIPFVRVLALLSTKRQHDIHVVVASPATFQVQLGDLTASLRDKMLLRIGNFPLPEGFALPTEMRTEHIALDEEDISDSGWDLIEVKSMKRRYVAKLSPEQIELPPWSIWNVKTLIQKLESGWNLEKWT